MTSVTLRAKSAPPILVLLLVGWAACAGACSGNARTEPGAKDLRLVIDAGSSGTRFCLFRVDATCRIVNAHANESECTAVPSPDGLAALGGAKAADVIQRGLSSLKDGDKTRVQSGTILGTGGFRAVSAGEQTAVMRSAVEALKSGGFAASGFVLKGEEEAALAWESVRQIFGSSEHSTLETGGATVQLTTGRGAPEKFLSVPDGMNHSLGLVEKLPAFGACRQGQGSDFDKCRTLVLEKIFAKSELRRTASGFSQAEKDTALTALGRAMCRKTTEELVSLGADKARADRTCWLLAYQSALLETAGGTRIRDGRESWPRGAAASARYFPPCAKIN
ncbi:MAG: hypothetical protein HY042_01280 [Spirochaetia bacterium]|nr:hypothetical protein [Spirochaetia bacterium]